MATSLEIKAAATALTRINVAACGASSVAASLTSMRNGIPQKGNEQMLTALNSMITQLEKCNEAACEAGEWLTAITNQ